MAVVIALEDNISFTFVESVSLRLLIYVSREDILLCKEAFYFYDVLIFYSNPGILILEYFYRSFFNSIFSKFILSYFYASSLYFSSYSPEPDLMMVVLVIEFYGVLNLAKVSDNAL